MKPGISGNLTKRFITSPLTPLILLASLVMGLAALVSIPREEEPQISVPMVDIFVRADGLRAQDAVELVTEPLEAIVKAIDQVEHVYSQTRDDTVLITARFLVGTDSDDAILRVHEEIRANFDQIPVGIPEPLIVGRGINDVAIVVATLSPSPEIAEKWHDSALFNIVEELRAEIMTIDDVGLTYIVGGGPDQIRVEPDPERLSIYGITLQQLVGKVRDANRSFVAGRVRDLDRSLPVVAGQTLEGIPDIGLLLLTTRDGKPVYVRDVADVVLDASPGAARVWNFSRSGDNWSRTPAISLAIAKREGANAVVVAEQVLEHLEHLKGTLIPEGVQIFITRDYGETADEKANELLYHLALATISIVLLITFVVGWREGIVVFIVIPTTILLTMFASNMMGYTINRVSLFALIFSIGILVDDAIVMIENIARHWAMKDGRTKVAAAIEAVSEVGNPTVIATLTVVTALLPMLFVSGLMGPYMAPIPVNASVAMVISFFVAVMIAPWLMLKLSRDTASGEMLNDSHNAHEDGGGILGSLYRQVARPIISSRRRSRIFLFVVAGATLASLLLIATGLVTVKLLPFDNKSEIQVVIDLPEGSSSERTERVLTHAAELLYPINEIVSIQSHSNTSAPFNFNGLVRHYFLRQSPELGDLQINLLPKGDRKRTSHKIALEMRERLSGLVKPDGTAVSVVEVPPGPPVLATLLAEIYGPDAETRRAVAREIRKIFEGVPFIVDVDDSMGSRAPRLHLEINQEHLEFFGVEQRDVYDTLAMLLNGVPVGYSHRGDGRNPIEIAVELPARDLSWSERLASTPVPSNALPGDRRIAELGDVLSINEIEGSHAIYRRNGRFAEMVTAELAGLYEAPIYGMMEVQRLIDEHDWGALERPSIRLHGQPSGDKHNVLLWDGEWEVTYVTFRDMGSAFALALLGIYFLVVVQFGSFRVPIVVLTPVPLTLIGIMLGHWIFGAAFTATSMIGFIALAGIIVRNSILLVDFIRSREGSDATLESVLLEAGSIRFKPILLTAVAAMIGAGVILFDPIFQGLAISLLFGLASSTLLTVLVIPAIYRVFKSE